MARAVGRACCSRSFLLDHRNKSTDILLPIKSLSHTYHDRMMNRLFTCVSMRGGNTISDDLLAPSASGLGIVLPPLPMHRVSTSGTTRFPLSCAQRRTDTSDKISPIRPWRPSPEYHCFFSRSVALVSLCLY